MIDIINSIKSFNLPVIIFGARVVGEAIYHSCKEQGIDIECFCDNNDNILDQKICNLNIINAKKLPELYKDAVFIISSTYIHDITSQLEEYGFNNWFDSRAFLKDFNIYNYAYSQDVEFVDFSVNTCILSHENFLGGDKLYLRSIDLILTEKCSLKCKDCCNLMQYYQNPQNNSLESIFNSIDAICSYVDEINEMRLIGGDAFMHKQWHKVVEKLINEPKVKKIVIYANGIILPTDIQVQRLKHNKVLVIFTEYGELSKNLKPLCKLFDEESINYHVINIATGWMDAGKINKHNRTNQDLKEILRFCCVKNYSTLNNGILYRCPFHANAFKLKAVPDNKSEYINLFEYQENNTNKLEVISKLREFLFKKDIFTTCDYCNGRSYGVPEDIEPAIQTKKTLDYKKYD